MDQSFRNTYCKEFTNSTEDNASCRKNGWFVDPANNTIYVNRGNIMFSVDPQKFDLERKIHEPQSKNDKRESRQGIDSFTPISKFYSLPPPSRAGSSDHPMSFSGKNCLACEAKTKRVASCDSFLFFGINYLILDQSLAIKFCQTRGTF